MEARAKTVGALERAGPLTEEHAKAGKENIWPGRDSEKVKTGGRCIKRGRRGEGGRQGRPAEGAGLYLPSNIFCWVQHPSASNAHVLPGNSEEFRNYLSTFNLGYSG